jgi:hypothetical protein
MNAFLRAFAEVVVGMLHGFDRLVFRGHLRRLVTVHGMKCHLTANEVMYRGFDAYVQRQTARLIDASLETAVREKRPIIYLTSTNISKEEEAAKIAARDGVRDGLIAVFKCVEPCWTFEMHRSRARKLLELQGKMGKCSFLYHYYQHPQFGRMYGRVQTWFPFAVQIGINGREWLAQQLQKGGLRYRRYDNKVTWVEDLTRAQDILHGQLQENWPQRLDEIRRLIHPAHMEMMGRLPTEYHWSAFQSEWASDILFRSSADVERVFSTLVRHAFVTFRSAHVMRFLGRAMPESGHVHGNFAGEIKTTVRHREEGVCIRHAVNGNSIKAYNGPGFIRLETTINHPNDFKVYRAKEGDDTGKKDWRVLRKGVADLHRRATVCQAANDRYAAGLAAVKDTTPLKELIDPLCRRTLAPGNNPHKRKVRGLNPVSPKDAALLEAVVDPKFTVCGLRNRDLVQLLYPKPPVDDREKRRRSACVTNLIRLLRAHGLLQKVPKSHRYQMSADARTLITAVLAARNANTEALTANAA